MTTEPPTPEQPDEAPAPPEAESEAPRGPRMARGTGHSLGGTEGESGIAGRVADFAQRIRDAAESARTAAEERRPAAEAIARVARERAGQVIDAARPRLEQAAQDVTTYAREHDEQLRNAMARAARIAASMAIPPALRPMADAMSEELHRKPEPKADAAPAEPTHEGEPSGSDSADPGTTAPPAPHS